MKTKTVNHVLRKVLGPGYTSYSLRNSVTKHLAATDGYADEDRARKAGHIDVKQTREYEGERAYAESRKWPQKLFGTDKGREHCGVF